VVAKLYFYENTKLESHEVAIAYSHRRQPVGK